MLTGIDVFGLVKSWQVFRNTCAGEYKSNFNFYFASFCCYFFPRGGFHAFKSFELHSNGFMHLNVLDCI